MFSKEPSSITEREKWERGRRQCDMTEFGRETAEADDESMGNTHAEVFEQLPWSQTHRVSHARSGVYFLSWSEESDGIYVELRKPERPLMS